MTRFFPLCIFCLFFFIPQTTLADEIVSVKPGYLSLSPSGTFSADSQGITGTRLDIEDDLNYDDSQGALGEVAFNLGSMRLAVSYLPIEFEGQSNLNLNLNFNGISFPVGAQAASHVKLDILEGALTFHLINLDDAPIRLQLGPEISVKYVDAELELASNTLGLNETVSEQLPIPTIGARARIALSDFIGIVGRFGYMQYAENELSDYELQVEFSPIPFLGLFGGYRFIDIKIDQSGLFVDASMQGPFAGVLARF